MSTKHSALVDSRGTLRVGGMAIATDPLLETLWYDDMIGVVLGRAAADPERACHSEALRKAGHSLVEVDSMSRKHLSEVLIPRAIAWFHKLEVAERIRLVEELRRERRKADREWSMRMYWVGVKGCSVRADGLTEILHRDGAVELFDSRGKHVHGKEDTECHGAGEPRHATRV